MTTIVMAITGGIVLSGLVNGLRMYRKPAPAPDMAEVWQAGGPL